MRPEKWKVMVHIFEPFLKISLLKIRRVQSLTVDVGSPFAGTPGPCPCPAGGRGSSHTWRSPSSHQGWKGLVPGFCSQFPPPVNPQGLSFYARTLTLRARLSQANVALVSERPERGPEQWHALQVLVLGHAELRRGRRGGGG